jgi:hypothetical protein
VVALLVFVAAVDADGDGDGDGDGQGVVRAGFDLDAVGVTDAGPLAGEP